jgi:hypothetical protein
LSRPEAVVKPRKRGRELNVPNPYRTESFCESALVCPIHGAYRFY